MRKEYLTGRLFKKHRIDNEFDNKELRCLDQKQTFEIQDPLEEKSQIIKSNEVGVELSSLSSRWLNIIRKVLKAFCSSNKD